MFAHSCRVLWGDRLQPDVAKFHLHRRPGMGVQGQYASRWSILVVIVEYDGGEVAVCDMNQDTVLCNDVVFNPAIPEDCIDFCTIVEGSDEARDFTINKLSDLTRQRNELPLASMIAS